MTPTPSDARELVSNLIRQCNYGQWLTVLKYFGPWLAEHDPGFLIELIAQRTPWDKFPERLAEVGVKLVPA